MKRHRGPQETDLANVPLFAGCTRKELADISQLTFEVQRSAGNTLCREGETGLECLIIIEGEASVTVAGRQVASIGPGGFVGELSLLDGRPRVATVTAITDVRLLALSRWEFKALLSRVPSVALRMLAIMGSRLRSTDELVIAGHDLAPNCPTAPTGTVGDDRDRGRLRAPLDPTAMWAACPAE